MKKLFIAFSMLAMFAACNNKPKETVAIVDTAAIRQKAILDEQARVRTENDQKALNLERDKLEAERNRLAATRRRIASSESRRSSNSNPNVGSSANTSANGSGTATQAPVKRGWSDAAKGTAIGAGAGALAGVLIDRKDAKGAIIGGILGAGTGYVIGRAKDRKSGRVQPQQ